MTLAITIAIMVAGGVFLMLQRGLVRIVLGLLLVGHAVNLLLMSAGGVFRRGQPLLGNAPAEQAADPPPQAFVFTALVDAPAEQAADPLPQAFVLTAIVIAFSIVIYMLTLAATGGDDDTEDAS